MDDTDRGKAEGLWKRTNPSQCPFVHRKSTWTALGANQGFRGEKPATELWHSCHTWGRHIPDVMRVVINCSLTFLRQSITILWAKYLYSLCNRRLIPYWYTWSQQNASTNATLIVLAMCADVYRCLLVSTQNNSIWNSIWIRRSLV